MKKTVPLLILGLICITSCKQGDKWVYPETKKVDVTDDYFGMQVADPYRWLEYDTAEDVKAWVKTQNVLTDNYLSKIPFREELRNRFTGIWNYPKYGSPFKKGDRYFFLKNDGLQNQYVLYMQNSLDGEAEVLLDPNTFSENGTVSLAGLSFSKDGKYMSYMTSTGGSDWRELYVLNVETKEHLSDHLEWIKFSGMAWLDDGFFYSAYGRPEEGASKLSAKNEYHKVYYHKLGTPQSEDKLMYEDPKNPLRNFGFNTDEDEQFIFLTGSEGTSGNSLYVKSTKNLYGAFTPISEIFDYDFSPVDVIDGKVLVMTNQNAPKYRLILVDPAKPTEEHWQNFVPETEDILQGAALIGGKVLVTYLRNAQSTALAYNTDGTLSHEVAIPPMGSASFTGSKHDNIAFYSFSSYTTSGSIYKYDMSDNTSELFRRSEIDFDSEAYETEQIFFESKDGTKVPMFVTHKKGIALDGNNPLLLYGYGGFNIPLTPGFSISNIPFLENGGIYVVVNLRGGGEFGSDWHKAGTQMRKQNVFDDFIAATEWLIANKYTNPDKIAILGGSNGGLLVGACMTQRPELFKVALPQVGVLDMLRYHKFTIGWAWAGDYGTSEDSQEMFEYLKAYSPLHNSKEGVNYPATFVTTADHDDRVVPAHSFKFIATLQEKDGGKNPILIRIETDAGHGSGKPTTKVIEETTDRWAFTMYNLGMNPKF